MGRDSQGWGICSDGGDWDGFCSRSGGGNGEVDEESRGQGVLRRLWLNNDLESGRHGSQICIVTKWGKKQRKPEIKWRKKEKISIDSPL